MYIYIYIYIILYILCICLEYILYTQAQLPQVFFPTSSRQAMVDAQAAMGSLDEAMRLATEQQRRYKGLKARPTRPATRGGRWDGSHVGIWWGFIRVYKDW